MYQHLVQNSNRESQVGLQQRQSVNGQKKRGQVTATQKKEKGDWLEDRQNERDRIYQNGRGHSASGSGGEIVTLSPGIGCFSLEVLRGCGA